MNCCVSMYRASSQAFSCCKSGSPAQASPSLMALLCPKEFQVKMESLQQRREELEHKEEQLKEAFFKFDKFLKVSMLWGRRRGMEQAVG